MLSTVHSWVLGDILANYQGNPWLRVSWSTVEDAQDLWLASEVGAAVGKAARNLEVCPHSGSLVSELSWTAQQPNVLGDSENWVWHWKSPHYLNFQSDRRPPTPIVRETSQGKSHEWMAPGRGLWEPPESTQRLRSHIRRARPNQKQNEKTTYRMAENFCKQCDWQGLNFQNIQTAHTAQYQKTNRSKNGQKT